MTEDRRQQDAPCSVGRRYEDVKAAASTAADRIGNATAELVRAFREMQADEPNKVHRMVGRL